MIPPIASPTPEASFPPARRQDKPWGHEAIFAAGEHGYVGKLITVSAGQSLSLQYHLQKDETISVITGEATLEHGSSARALHTRTMRGGDTVHLPPTVLHRITARTDLLLVETSSAGLGWSEDIVRVADRYGRTGTRRA